ncbi:tetratricopeptide repeat protein [Streptomyces sp. NPDC127066]|uniref:tetratricopeptide repeat protein n=1 Tax=Streptomyces sp. NPDC127066 TaxID=3347125 RepID=UPI0036494393
MSWLARASASTAAISHGRGAEAPPELETLIMEVGRTVDAGPNLRAMLLDLRSNRVAVLVQQDRYTEAETEAQDILRAITRIAHLTEVWETELAALTNLAAALNRQGRHEEAEAIARQALTVCEQFLHPTHPRIQDARTLLTRIATENPAPT